MQLQGASKPALFFRDAAIPNSFTTRLIKSRTLQTSKQNHVKESFLMIMLRSEAEELQRHQEKIPPEVKGSGSCWVLHTTGSYFANSWSNRRSVTHGSWTQSMYLKALSIQLAQFASKIMLLLRYITQNTYF